MNKRILNQQGKVESLKNAYNNAKGKEKKKIKTELDKEEDKLNRLLDADSFIAKQTEIIRQKERVEAVAREEETAARVCGGDYTWKSLLKFDDDGNLIYCLHNTKVIVDHHPKYGTRLRKNVFTNEIEWNNNPMTDELLTRIYFDIYNITGIDRKQWVQDSIVDCAATNRYHPILEKVKDLEWDGRDRLCDFFIKTVGAEDTPLTKELSFRWLCAMYRRVKNPGCYFDAYLILSDPTQGTGKSTVFQKLTEGLGITHGNGDTVVLTTVNAKPDLGDKDMAMIINASAIVQFDESKNMKRAAVEDFKSFITQRDFTMRLPYERYVTSFKVHCVYALTTNDEKFLSDPTTNYERRAWVLPCKGKAQRSEEEWNELLPQSDIEQIWAEAKYFHEHQGEAEEMFGWKINGSNIHRLTEEAKAALVQVQAGAKTMEDDTEIVNAIETVFTQQYTANRFANASAFYNDHDKWANKDATWNKTITKIPMKWAHGYVCKLSRSCSLSYFNQQMQSPSVENLIGKWVKKDHVRYGSVTVTCYVKEGCEDAETEEKAQKNTKKIAEKPRKNSVFLAENCDFSKDGLAEKWDDSDDFTIDL